MVKNVKLFDFAAGWCERCLSRGHEVDGRSIHEYMLFIYYTLEIVIYFDSIFRMIKSFQSLTHAFLSSMGIACLHVWLFLTFCMYRISQFVQPIVLSPNSFYFITSHCRRRHRLSHSRASTDLSVKEVIKKRRKKIVDQLNLI